MKKGKQIIFVAALALVLSMAVKVQTKAAAVTNVQQTDSSKSSIGVKCDAYLGADYYYLEMSTDQKTWTVMDVSSSPSSLDVYSLSSGTTYYARVGLCSNWSTDDPQKIAGTVSSAIDVVTAPAGDNLSVTQANATTSGVSATLSGAIGANWYQLIYDNATIGEGASATVSTSKKLSANSAYWVHLYACRRSSSGYVARGDYGYGCLRTLAPKVSKGAFGISNAYTNINIYDFAVSSGNNVSGFQWQFKVNGKTVKTVTASGNSTSISDFVNGKYIQYRVRSYVTCGTKNVYGQWSDYKSVGAVKNATWKFKNKKLTVKWSKVTGASSYTVYASTKEKSGYKKVKTVKANKRKVTIKKIGKKKLKKGKTYYIRIVPNRKSGKKQVKADSYKFFKVTIY